MAATSVATVVSFESVGAILVIAFLVVPAATAFLITKDLKRMVVVIIIQGFLNSFGGYMLSNILNASISGSMAVISFVGLAIVFLVTKKEG